MDRVMERLGQLSHDVKAQRLPQMDSGLIGRDHEIKLDSPEADAAAVVDGVAAQGSRDAAPAGGEHWRVVRARNKWQPAEDCARHPVPGTYPVVITGEAEWGGWRVPGAEYDLNPNKMEQQARLIASAPQLAAFAAGLVDWVRKSGEDMPDSLANLAHEAQDILAHVKGQ